MARSCRKLTARLAALLAAGLVLLSGCSSREAPEDYVPPVELDAELTLQRELLDDAGEKLAVYSAALPQLQEVQDTAAHQINAFYRSELTVLEADCESWFDIVAGKNYDTIRTNQFTYRLLDAPEGFLSVERTMEVDGVVSHYFTEYFSLVSGWQRTFADLYSSTVKCEALIRGQVRDRCLANSVPCDKLDTMSLGQLTAEFLLHGDQLRLYYDHRILSDEQDTALVVEIPLSLLEDYLLN